MPTCKHCGNKLEFSSSRVQSEVPYANPPFPLQGSFDRGGNLDQVEYTGNQDVVEDAWEHPKDFFDTCSVCGSQDIAW